MFCSRPGCLSRRVSNWREDGNDRWTRARHKTHDRLCLLEGSGDAFLQRAREESHDGGLSVMSS